jgi:phosphoribosylformylglycinamidine synthase subunit PurL
MQHPLAVLFGEAPSRVVVSVAPADYARLVDLAAAHGVQLTQLGSAGGDHFTFAQAQCPLTDLHAAHEYGLAEALGKATL